MSTFKSIVMSGYYGFDNSGDDAILKAITKDILKENKDIEIIVLSNNPEKTKKEYNINAVNRFKFCEVIKALKSSSLLISGGGSLLQDVTSTRSLLYYLGVMKIAKLFKKPVMVYANGIGPINGKLNRHLTKKILNKVNLITLRDEDSKDFVQKLGVKNKNIYVTADPVFTLKSIDKNSTDLIFKEENIPLEGKYIGISVRKWTEDEHLIKQISKTIKYINEELNIKTIIIPMHYPEDLDISRQILKNVDSTKNFVLNKEYSAEEIMGVINKLELIVAMRLHSLIYAATQETPMIGLSYDPKVDGILKSLNIENNCDVEKFTSDELIKNIEYVLLNKEKLIENLVLQDEALKRKALENVSMALELLGVDN